MANKVIIIKPLISEKSTKLAENTILNQYTFIVDKSANKIEIKKAVEAKFGITVVAVNTSVRPGKKKARVVKGRYVHGKTASIKKAYVTVAEGQFIEGFYGETAEVEEINAEA
jgi:large subunit ribosomal protein L23